MTSQRMPLHYPRRHRHFQWRRMLILWTNSCKTPKYFRYEKNNQPLVSDPEWQISVSGDTMSHPSLGYASTGICDIVSPLTEICHSGTDTSCRFYYSISKNMVGKIFNTMFYHICQCRVFVMTVREKGRYLTQSYDISPYTHRLIQNATWQHNNATKNYRLHNDCGST